MEHESCPKCGGPLRWHQPYGYPVIAQIAFGLSFVLFLVYFDRVREQPTTLWGWSAAQIALAVLLVRGRLRARRRVLRCIRCTEPLP